MKTRLLICVVAGFLLTVAGAWIPAAFDSSRFGWQVSRSGRDARLPAYLRKEWRVISDSRSISRIAFGLRLVEIDGVHRQRGDERMSLMRREYGWPFAVMTKDDFGLSIPGDAWPRLQELYDHAGLRIGLSLFKSDPRSVGKINLPIWPRPQFALMTCVFALVVYGAVWGPRAVRGWMRRRRGQCVTCGYPRSESSTCPECGQAV